MFCFNNMGNGNLPSSCRMLPNYCFPMDCGPSFGRPYCINFMDNQAYCILKSLCREIINEIQMEQQCKQRQLQSSQFSLMGRSQGSCRSSIDGAGRRRSSKSGGKGKSGKHKGKSKGKKGKGDDEDGDGRTGKGKSKGKKGAGDDDDENEGSEMTKGKGRKPGEKECIEIGLVSKSTNTAKLYESLCDQKESKKKSMDAEKQNFRSLAKDCREYLNM